MKASLLDVDCGRIFGVWFYMFAVSRYFLHVGAGWTTTGRRATYRDIYFTYVNLRHSNSTEVQRW